MTEAIVWSSIESRKKGRARKLVRPLEYNRVKDDSDQNLTVMRPK
jgi:hypothetical protein